MLKNKFIYVKKYYDVFNDNYFLRFWIFGFYFDLKKKDNDCSDG